MSRLPMRLPSLGVIPLALMMNAGSVETASAHVKWFCAYNVAGQPLGLENVLCPDFEMLVGISIAWLLFGSVVEWSFIGDAMLRAMDRATKFIEENTELIFRIGCVFFFVSIWAIGGIILTPELKTDSNWIGAIQLAIAAGMVSRRTMPLSAIGIFALFDIALWKYGVFHLADYPIFLGVAAYVALAGGADQILRCAPHRRGALGGGHHPDVGFHREMGLPGMVVPAVHRAPKPHTGLYVLNSTCGRPGPLNSRLPLR